MSEFIYLYRGGEERANRSPQEMQQVMQKWVGWLQGLAEQGHLKDRGQPLERGGKIVSGKQKIVTDGPFAEAKDLVGGFTVVVAGDLQQAAELSKGCPIFDAGGFVEVRPVLQM
jgi:hypothetical protein